MIGLDGDDDPDNDETHDGRLFVNLAIFFNQLRFLGSGVVSLQALGVIDMGAMDVGDNEVLAHALTNVSDDELQRGFAIKWGGSFVNEYAQVDSQGRHNDRGFDDPNHLVGLFPVLWPYAMGMPETQWPIDVPYNVHVQATLQYGDRHFALHHQFIFQAFGVLQKHQVCSATCLQVQRKTFVKNQAAFWALTPKDLLLASGEESRKVPFSNPVVKALRHQITALRTKVMGTDESRVKMRGQIKGMCVMKGPPSLWITINPSDTGDPIAQVFAGENIDLDMFVKSSGPNSDERSQTIAADPYVAAKFFYFVITTLLEDIFGITAYKGQTQVSRTDGVFGKVASYIGKVEAQGHGTLHLHIVVWLCGSLSSMKMRDALRSQCFCAKVTAYIAVNIKADLDGANAAAVNNMLRVKNVSYSRPCDPRNSKHVEVAHLVELQLARAVQHHKCTKRACLIVKNNQLQCKCRAPFEVSTRDFIDADSHWGPKRPYRFINNWCPTLMHLGQSQH